MSKFAKVHYVTSMGHIMCGIETYPGIDYIMNDWENITCTSCLERGFENSAAILFRFADADVGVIERIQILYAIQKLKDIVAREHELNIR